MMYIGLYRNNEIDKRINVSKIANNISTLGDEMTEISVQCDICLIIK